LETYILITGSGNPTVTAHPEVYIRWGDDTATQIASAADQVFDSADGLKHFSISMSVTNTYNSLTNGTRLMLRWKFTSKTGTPTWNFVVGGVYNSTLALNATAASSAYAGSFVGDGAGVTQRGRGEGIGRRPARRPQRRGARRARPSRPARQAGTMPEQPPRGIEHEAIRFPIHLHSSG